jgi:hypothetical protein
VFSPAQKSEFFSSSISSKMYTSKVTGWERQKQIE